VVNGSLRGAKEQRSFKPQAEGSIPSGRTFCFRRSPAVEQRRAPLSAAPPMDQRVVRCRHCAIARFGAFGLKGQVSAYRFDEYVIGPIVNRSAKVDKLRKT
jgi:hypothetical protein